MGTSRNKGINNPNYGKPLSKEVKMKISASIKRLYAEGKKENYFAFHKGKKHPRYKGGLPKCVCGQIMYRTSKLCRNCYKHTSEFYKQIGLKGLVKQQNSKQPTSIEKAVYDYLLLKGILFEKQKLINGKFIVDAYIPSLNLVIEADGSYWHSLDRVKKKDKAENAYLKKCGFRLLRLSEQEIRDKSFRERMVS